MNVAVIPARGGSKRIPSKNIKEFVGKPVIAYPIDVLKRSNLFEHVLVSTDDDKIADAAAGWGAEVPFRRPAHLSDDTATTDEVLLHAIEEAQRIYGPIARACCVYPVNPLLRTEELGRGLQMLMDHAATSAFPVVRYDFPIEQALTLDGVRPKFKYPNMLPIGSQNFQPNYHDAGMFYWVNVEKFMRTPTLFSMESVAFEVDPQHCQDVNTPEDWAVAEAKFLHRRAQAGQ